ncbi:MAG: ABC transporter substrate-binding protein [Lachnospiraceae bacterium]|nr:ABC transporter substrate-binding protein [Lachnospiraceae bacterium]
MRRRTILSGVIMLLATAVLLCGCSKDDQSGTNENKDRYTVTFSLIDLYGEERNNNGDNSDRILKMIGDYCDVNVKPVWVPNDTLADRNSNYLLSPGQSPDIVSWGGTITGEVISAAKVGAFVDLNDYVWDVEKYPNLAGMSKDVAANLTVNGKLIGIPRTRVIGREGLSYRQDWAEKLGVTLPENATPEDVYKMLYAFTYQDPDGNGIDDTIGMEMTSYTGVFDIIQTWFGCGNGWQFVDGRLMPVWTTDEYFEAVDYIKRLYDEGLMPKDFALRPTDTWSNGCKSGENGVFIDVLDGGKRIWQFFEAEESFTPSVIDNTKAAEMVLYGAVNGRTLATAGYNGFFTLSAATLDTPEKIEAALRLLDKLNDREMLILTQYGIEGIHYVMDGELLVDTDKNDSSLSGDYLGLNQMLPYLPSTEAAVVPVLEDKFSKAQNEAYTKASHYAISNPALAYLVQSGTYALEGDGFDKNIQNLRNKYICGAITKEEFVSALHKVRTDGYDQIIIEVNNAYNAK